MKYALFLFILPLSVWVMTTRFGHGLWGCRDLVETELVDRVMGYHEYEHGLTDSTSIVCVLLGYVWNQL